MENKKLLLILVAGLSFIVILTIVLVLMNIGGDSTKATNLVFWGVFDDKNAYDAVIKDFEKANPGVKVYYRSFSTYEEYESGLLDALAAGTGPDMYMIHHTWLPKHGNKLAALPSKIEGEKEPLMTLKTFNDQFVEVAYDDFVYNGQIYALPLYVDTLALYYNRDMFNSAGITRPPENWDEFNTDVELLTRTDSSGNITQSGAALGTARNINRSTDILMSLMLQSGVKMVNEDKTEATFSNSVNGLAVGERALKFYTDFANPMVKTYSWSDSQHYSIDAFAEGNAAMMLNYSHQSVALRAKSARLNFAVAPMPQIAGATDKKNYANYWAVGVANKSLNINTAWKFVVSLTSKNGANKYLTTTNRPSARRDLIEAQKSDADLGIFAEQALTAKSWFQADGVAIEGIFADMIDDVNFRRRSIKEALNNAESRVSVLLRQIPR
ncbi:MAG: hypothetical protein A2457_00250 [Candidatus Yanofskybacteria bacterium RIFOXYC2_FULL_44_13]|nr:MAG: hypothetical protein A2457_00250 [Candidatus Yanofskybacteria bacterium RIFOXYC2_FULL_44_13]